MRSKSCSRVDRYSPWANTGQSRALYSRGWWTPRRHRQAVLCSLPTQSSWPLPGPTYGISQTNMPYYDHWSQGRGRRGDPWAPPRIRWVRVGSSQRLTWKPPPPYQSQGSSRGAIPLGPKLRSEASLTSNLGGVRWPASRSHLEPTPPPSPLHIPEQSLEPNS